MRCTANPSYLHSLQQLRKDLSPGGKHPVRKLIADGMEEWFRTGSALDTDLSLYPEHLRGTIRSALEDQGCIGWGQAAHGFLSKAWTHLACQDMLRRDRHEPDAGLRRMRTIISSIYDHSTRIWLARNEQLHSNEDILNRDIRSTEIAEIKALHKLPHLLRAGDRHYCATRSLDRLLSSPASTRRWWLRRVRTSIEEHKKDGGRQSLITSYFATSSDA